jgi:electron transfer flavoprotein alpha subunit
MPKLSISQDQVTPAGARMLADLCPFGAISYEDGLLQISAACKMCRICTGKGKGIITFVPDEAAALCKPDWKGITVYAEQHPVSLELIGKAKELAGVTHHPVQALVIGHRTGQWADKLLRCGADAVYVADSPALEHFLVEPYSNVFEDYIRAVRPSAVLIGATAPGRILAPRVAARFQTGLTADCTVLEMNPDTDLVQIRPAFGGNIMAKIITARHRPQFCTVRYRIFSAPDAITSPAGRIIPLDIEPSRLTSRTTLLEVSEKPRDIDISEAEALVAVGRGAMNKTGLSLARELADLLGARMACTRPLIEGGMFDPRCQIGLSGRTVKPRLIMTIGISGSVQFAAGMRNSDFIVAINQDRRAPIFDIAHEGFVGDLYDILPKLNKRLREYGL